MSLTLILSSYVAASRVGGFVQALALAAFGVEPVLAPTVLFGRHPGWGAPGGGPVDPDQFRSLLGGIAAQGLPGRADLLITGYFAHPDQVAAAAETIDQMRRDRPDGGYVVVDPVLGDEGKGLYVKPEVANAVRDLLTPRADLITPNRWELGWLSGCKVDTCDEIATAVHVRLDHLESFIPLGIGVDGIRIIRGMSSAVDRNLLVRQPALVEVIIR